MSQDRLLRVLKIWSGPFILGLILLVIAIRFVGPPPPKSITFAAGSKSGAYYAAAERYRDALAEYDVEVVILETAGSIENLRLLMNDEADVALIQGGTADAEHADKLRAMGAVFYEPLWVFTRQTTTDDLASLPPRTFAIGGEGSGTRALVTAVLKEWEGVDYPTEQTSTLSGMEAAAALINRRLDAVAFVASPEADYVVELLDTPGIQLLEFERAEALARRVPYLGKVVLFEGVVDVAGTVPERDTDLVATVAELVVAEDTHPAIQSILMESAFAIHRDGTLLSDAGSFPTRDLTDLELSEEARRYFDRGPTFLRRMFPFSVANFLERSWVLLIPLLTLMIPLARIAPPLYRWRVRRKIYIWYRDLRDLEHKGRHADTAAERLEVMDKLSTMQADTGAVEVPLSYTDDLYRLRNHIAFVSDLMGRLNAEDSYAKPGGQTPAKT